MQVSTLITHARMLLQDTVEPYRYTDQSMLGIINECMLEARRVRPDLFLGRLREDLDFVDTTGDDLPLKQQFFGPMLNFLVGRAEMRDDEFANDKRAITLYSAFHASMTKGPA